MTKKPLISLAEAEREMRSLKSIWSNESLLNTRMLFRALERLEEIAGSLRRKPRKQSAYNKFFAAGMRSGKSPVQIAKEWKAKKGK